MGTLMMNASMRATITIAWALIDAESSLYKGPPGWGDLIRWLMHEKYKFSLTHLYISVVANSYVVSVT